MSPLASGLSLAKLFNGDMASFNLPITALCDGPTSYYCFEYGDTSLDFDDRIVVASTFSGQRLQIACCQQTQPRRGRMTSSPLLSLLRNRPAIPILLSSTLPTGKS